MRKINYLISVIFIIFTFQSYAASIYDPGIQYCQSNPALCGLENYGSFERGKQQGISQCQHNPISCKIPLAFIETRPRPFSYDDPEIFVYLSSQAFTEDKQRIFEMGMESLYNYQLISKQRRNLTDPYVFDLKFINGLQ